ncbi:hypothetical protein HD600_001464 [Microbacterium ginsengiterrae]|uniref:DUF1761 family protein n=1 Tax=Microbacterium ginsengiterrae TaxID=546115 RepID=A0A7W9CCW4_9MICO|nr:DUF1761 domain-containing protein [Microbacterium ginsengiterrae]MBB5742967.1 hypothetical protein [Microbacterium ginsengiterrae]
MIPEINYWAVLIATVGSMIVGSIWYTPKVFGRRWAKLARVDLNDPNMTAAQAWMPLVIGAVMGFASAWVLAGASAISWHFYDGSFFGAAIVTAILLWAGFTAARFITHDGFERRPTTLTVLNIAHELVTFLVMGAVIGLWPPAGTV